MDLSQLFGTGLQGLLSDEEQQQVGSNALLNSGLAMIAASQGGQPGGGRVGLGSVLSQGLQAGTGAYQQGLQNVLTTQKAQKQAAIDAQRKQLLGAMYSPDGTPDLQRLQQAFAASLSVGDVDTAKFIGEQIKEMKPKYERVGKGETLINPATKEVIAQGVEDLPNAVREYKFAVSQGFPGTFQDFQIAQKRAGATNIVNKIGNTFGEDVAKTIAGLAMGNVQSGIGAVDTLQSVQTMKQALPKAITGPGSDSRVALTRLGVNLGVGGKDDQERLNATSQLIQGLAKSQLSVAQSMKGQGALSDSERNLMGRASSGDLSFSTGELQTLVNALEKTALYQYKIGKQQAERIKSDPNFSGISPYLSYPELPFTGNNNDPLGVR